MIRAILFDAGGTLIHVDGERFCAAAELPYDPEAFEAAELESRWGVVVRNPGSTDAERLPRFLDRFLQGLGVDDPDRRRRAAAQVAEEHRRANLWSGAGVGAARTLETLKRRGYRLGVVSNADGRVARLLAEAGLGENLDIVLDSALVGMEKPDPRIFLAAAERIGVAPWSCAFVGDLYEIDIVGARAAGFRAILIGACPAPEDVERIRTLAALLDLFPDAPFRCDPAVTAGDVETARRLFREYEASLGIDLCFQGFEAELAGLPGAYAPPTGVLLIVRRGDDAAGCVALRRLEEGVAEMKRLYVRGAYRGQGLGRLLAEEVLGHARRLGYSKMRLDTLPSMREAIPLYRSLGFKEIAAYTNNPVPGALFLEKDLSG